MEVRCPDVLATRSPLAHSEMQSEPIVEDWRWLNRFQLNLEVVEIGGKEEDIPKEVSEVESEEGKDGFLCSHSLP